MGVVVGIIVAMIAMTLAGCTAPETKLVTEVRTVEKQVPYLTKCIAADKVPEVPRTHFIRGGNIESNAAAASADVRDLAIYADQADAALRKCADNTQLKE